MASLKDKILKERKPTSSIMEAIRRKLAGKGKLTIKEKAELKKQKDKIKNMYGDSGRKGQTRNRKSTTVKGDPRTSMKPGSMPKAKAKEDFIRYGDKPQPSPKRMKKRSEKTPSGRGDIGKAGSMPKAGAPSGRGNIGKAGSMPKAKAPAGRGNIGKAGSMPRASGAPKTSKPPMKRPTQAIRDAAKPKPGKPNTEPRTIAQAKKMGKLYFVDKNGKKKAAVTAEDLKKSGHKTLRAYLNAKGKPAKKGK